MLMIVATTKIPIRTTTNEYTGDQVLLGKLLEGDVLLAEGPPTDAPHTWQYLASSSSFDPHFQQ